MPTREDEERLVAAGPVRHVSPENALDEPRAVLDLHVAIELATDAGIGAEAAADEHVETLDSVLAGVIDGHAAGDHADVADVVLRAGVGAAREMDVDGTVEYHPRLHPVGDRHRRALGV